MNFDFSKIEAFFGIVFADVQKAFSAAESALQFLNANQSTLSGIVQTIESISPNAPGNKKLAAAQDMLTGYLKVANVTDAAINQIIPVSAGVFSAIKQGMNANAAASKA